MINISKKQFEQDVHDGLKREEIIKKYSTETVKLTNSELSRILKATGLTIRKFQRPKFQLVDEPTNTAILPLDPTVAKEVKETAEKGNQLVDLSGEYASLAK